MPADHDEREHRGGPSADRFPASVRRAAANVLGTSAVGEQVLELCDACLSERKAIQQARVPDAIVIGVVGPTGQGKTWLVRQIVKDAQVRSQLRSGDRQQDATDQIVWIGPDSPTDLKHQSEQFYYCSTQNMLSLGVDYCVLDTPGATDCDPKIAEVARAGLSLASVQILVVRRDQLRSHAIGDMVTASEGTLILPVVSVVRQRDAALSADIDSYCQAIRGAAPLSQILSPIVVPDFDVEGTESDISDETLESIQQALRPRLAEAGGADRRQRARLAAADRRFRDGLNQLLRDELPYLTRAVDHLHNAADQLPADVAHSLIGSPGSLRASIRSRLRLCLLTETAALWFPYKSLLGVLNLTHGAWDRLVLSLSGSLPSLISSAWTTAKNIGQIQSYGHDAQNALRQQSAMLVRDRLSPLVIRFQQELQHLRPSQSAGHDSTRPRDLEHAQQAYLGGIDELQHMSHEIVEEEIESASLGRALPQMMGLIGTLIFWALMSGPIVSLYAKYFGASYDALTGATAGIEGFPAPKWAMLITSVLLSAIPTAIYAMLVLTLTQRGGRVDQCAQKIRQRHDDAIESLRREGVLRLEFDDPVLSDAEFLMAAGKRH